MIQSRPPTHVVHYRSFRFAKHPFVALLFRIYIKRFEITRDVGGGVRPVGVPVVVLETFVRLYGLFVERHHSVQPVRIVNRVVVVTLRDLASRTMSQ